MCGLRRLERMSGRGSESRRSRRRLLERWWVVSREVVMGMSLFIADCGGGWGVMKSKGGGGGGMRPTNKFGNKQTQAYTDRRDEIARVFLGCEHEDCKYQLRGQDHLYDYALCDGRAASERGTDG